MVTTPNCCCLDNDVWGARLSATVDDEVVKAVAAATRSCSGVPNADWPSTSAVAVELTVAVSLLVLPTPTPVRDPEIAAMDAFDRPRLTGTVAPPTAGPITAPTEAGSVKLAGTVIKKVVLPFMGPMAGIITGATWCPDVNRTGPPATAGEAVDTAHDDDVDPKWYAELPDDDELLTVDFDIILDDKRSFRPAPQPPEPRECFAPPKNELTGFVRR